MIPVHDDDADDDWGVGCLFACLLSFELEGCVKRRITGRSLTGNLKLSTWTRQFISLMLEMNPAIRGSRRGLNPKEKRQFSCFYHIRFPCNSISLCLYKNLLDKVF